MAGKQVVKADQIRGSHGESLEDDILYIISKARNAEVSVSNKSDLPVIGNDNGDIRLVRNDHKLYQWSGDAAAGEWICITSVQTETRTIQVPVLQDGILLLKTDIDWDVILELDQVHLYVNGVVQKYESDFGLTQSNQGKAEIRWVSPDFQLETTDAVQVVYDTITEK